MSAGSRAGAGDARDEVPEGSYRCECCGGVFEKGWTDEECAAEAAEMFPGMAGEDAAMVCDVCFEKLMAQLVERSGNC